MGVKDLWQLLSPIGRRVSIETLEGKTLAIDASIWITQFIKAMRDEEGKMMKNAHLIGTIRRVLKLLFHRIRPLFVFDGATPALKLRTVQARRKGHEKQEESKRVAAQRLLRARLKEFAVKQSKVSTSVNEGAETEQSGTFVSSFKRSAGQGSKATASTPSTALTAEAGANSGDVKDETDDVEWMDGYENLKGKNLDAEGGETRGEDGEGEDEMQWQLPEDCGDLSAEALAALPAHLRKSLIEEARRRQRMQSRAHYLPVAGNPALYSQTQLSNFLNSSKLNRKFIDAHQSTQSTLVGTSIAAEGKKKYQFISRFSMVQQQQQQDMQREPAAAAASVAFTDEYIIAADAVAVSSSSTQSNFAAATSSFSSFSASTGFVRTAMNDEVFDRNDDKVDEANDDDDDANEGFWMPQVVYDDHDGDEKVEKTVVSTSTATKDATAAAVFAVQQEVEEGEEEDRSLTLAIAESLRDNFIRKNNDNLDKETRASRAFEDAEDKVEWEENKEDKKDKEVEEEVAWESGSDSNNSNSNDGNNYNQSDAEEGTDFNDEGGAESTGTTGNGWMADEAWFEEAQDEVTRDSPFKVVRPIGDLKSANTSQHNAEQDTHAEESKYSAHSGSHSNINNNHNTYNYTNHHESSIITTTSSSHGVMSSEVLDRAVHTASSMADWAGRAVRNALKEHTRNSQQHLQQPQHQHQPQAQHGAHRDLRPLVDPVTPLTTTQAKNPAVVNNAAQSPTPTPLTLPVSHEAKSNEETGLHPTTGVADESTTATDSAVYDFTFMSAEETAIEAKDARRKFNAAMRDTETLTEEMRCEVIELLQALNLPYLIAPYEAEAQCAVLEQLGLVDGVVTEDSDALLFGANTVYKNIFNDKKYVEVYLAEDARREMGLHREDLVALAYFLGSDYCEGVAGVGIVNAVEIIHAFPMHAKATNADEEGALESASAAKITGSAASTDAGSGPLTGLRRFKDWLHGFDLEQELRFSAKSSADQSHADDEALVAFTQKHRSGRGRWSVPGSFPDPLVARAYLHPQADRSPDSFAWTVPDAHSIRAFCRERLGWTEPQMDMAIDPVLRRYAERSNQPRIDAHFLTYHGDTRFAKIASDRLREAVVQITGKRTNLALGGGGSATTSTGTSKRAKSKKAKPT